MAKSGNHHNSCYIIAEAGVNHNGDIALAKKLVDAAVEAGADAIKFQTFKAEKVISRNAPKAEYQKESTGEAESQLDMVKRLELSEDTHFMLKEYCCLKNIEFLSTPFDFDSIDFLARKLNLLRIKIPSGEITNGPYLLHAAHTGKPVILSTGMSTLEEIEAALGVLAFGYLPDQSKPSLQKFRAAYCSMDGRKIIKEKVVLLHCTTEYPAPFNEINLKAMQTMRKVFGLPVGLSDHSRGIAVPIAAVALGAVIIEKHFTLDRHLSGPDHKASLEPGELREMVSCIRQVESAMGSSKKKRTLSEEKNVLIVRKCLVAAMQINSGEAFTVENMTCKRPGMGISPMEYWELLGKRAKKNYSEDELISK